jgi:hypothetical protein
MVRLHASSSLLSRGREVMDANVNNMEDGAQSMDRCLLYVL